MYLISIEVKESIIEGRGVFALQNIAKNTIVWKYEPIHDKTMPLSDFDSLSANKKFELNKVGYISKQTNQWVYPPESDPARFTNHSTSNNLSVILDASISDEPIFIANRNIAAGEELTNNYAEFDVRTDNDKPDWI